jgi:hypothetical protein
MNRIAAFGVLGLAMVALSGGARASDGVFMKDLLGSVGIIPEDKPPIAYRERAPLVLPPKASSLPAPVEPVRQRNPEWPNDPEVVAQKRRDERAAVPITLDERHRMLHGNPRLSVDEMRAGRREGVGIPTEPSPRLNDNNSRDALLVHPDVLRAQRQGSDDKPSDTREPRRKTLTEPPTGFRKPSEKAAMRNDFEPVIRQDEADPIGYIRQQNGR